MIDQFVIFTPQGVVLYRYAATGRKFAEQQINKFIANCLVANPLKHKDEGNNKYPVQHQDAHAVMYHLAKQPQLCYVATYAAQSLELTKEAEQLLTIAIKLWESLQLNKGITANLDGKKASKKNSHNYTWVLAGLEDQVTKFDEYFQAKCNSLSSTVNASKKESKHAAVAPKKTNKKTDLQQKPSKSRKWGRDGTIEEFSTADSSNLDFSESTGETGNSAIAEIDKSSFGSRTDKGDFLIKEIDELLSKNKSQSNTSGKNSTAGAFGFLQKHLLGNKTITEKDLATILEKFKQKLMTKNVAPEVAAYLATQVSQDLVGSKTANWTSVELTARDSLQKALTKILTPGVSVDLLREIQQKTSTKTKDGKKQPYVFSVVGVNGVGKSTNLSKLAFWLLQNNMKVLVVACDTFRSGAVEQLRVHVENLAQLTDESHVRGSRNNRGKTGNDHVELFEAGYGGSDLVTKVAKQAIKYASDYDFDIVLMDTAGRRHNDPTLMSPLKSFAEQAKPDKIIMVGEALVGTDSVQQAKNFNMAFGKERDLDFFIISKCDTVGEMLGTMVNMVYATGIPILFVGVGQTYTDLRTLSVDWAVDTLMS